MDLRKRIATAARICYAVTLATAVVVCVRDVAAGSPMQEGTWRLAPTPDVDIGVQEGAPEYQLFRVVGVVRLSDGRLVVANAGSSELRFFDPDGVHLFSVGSRGSGPGEFESLRSLWLLPGDSLLVYDARLMRASVFGSDGGFARSYRVAVPGGQGFPVALAAFGDGTILIKSMRPPAGGVPEGLARRDEVYYTVSPAGDIVDSVGSFPGPEQFVRTGGDATVVSVSVMVPTFGRTSVVAAHGAEFCVGTGDAYEIQCYAIDGSPRRTVRRDTPTRPVTQADIDRMRELELTGPEDQNARREIERRYREVPMPKTMPAYADLTMDHAGNLWVRAYEPDPFLEGQWTVFDASGRIVAGITTPPRFTIAQIGDDFVLGTWVDDLGVEYVRRYPLLKPRRRR